MKIKSSIHTRCANCKLIRRKGRVYVTCSNPRHKQKQG